MPTVKTVLHRYLRTMPAPHLGASAATLSRKELANDLMAVSRANRTYFVVCVAVILLVLLGAAAIALRYLDSPDHIRTIFGVLGISITGLVAQLVSLWKQKVMADTVLVLCRSLDELTLKPVLDVLLAKL